MVFVVLAVSVLTLVGALVANLLRGGGVAGLPAPVVGFLVVFGLFLVVGRFTWRWAGPVYGVMSAADRVAEGDLGARASERGPRPVRRLARSFNTMATRLEDDDARRRQLLADIAHELRTPLSVVRGNLEGLADGVYQPDDERLGRLVAEVAHVERLLDDLRTLSNADAGVLTLELEDVSVGALVERIAERHAERARSADASIEVRIEGELPLLTADPARLEQVIDNLVDNAIRHGRGVSVISLVVTAKGPELVIIVEDDGAGIADHLQAGLFDRLSRSTSRDGTGLGLPIAKRLVERHAGTIGLSSGPAGTSVEVRLPLAGP